MSIFNKCQPSIDRPCLDTSTIVDGGGEIVHQIDGTVSIWLNGIDGLYPYTNINTKPCCEYLGYTFDIENQKCLWSEPIDCDTCEIKVVINPNGNDGELFNVSDNDNCTLDISLDYIFKFDCSALTSGETTNDEVIHLNEQILHLNGEIVTLESECALLSATCIELTAIYTGMCYPIIVANRTLSLNVNEYYSDNRNPNLDSLNLPSNKTTVCCLSEEGLLRWESILGEIKFNAWLASDGCDRTLYTNQQAKQLFIEGTEIATTTNSVNPYLIEINDDLCDKNSAHLNQIAACDEYQNCLNHILDLQNQINVLELQLIELEPQTCEDPIQNFELFQASLSLDVETETPGLYETAYEESIFNIGEGNLMQYIIDNQGLTGIIISGETGVLPPFGFESTCDYDEVCKSKRDEFMRELYLREYLPAFGEPENSLQNAELLELMGSWYNSSWLSYNVTINDSETIAKIKNKKIRISFKINNCCLDFGILLDKVKVTQNCDRDKNELIKITKPFGFDLDKFVDNKKSWVSSEVTEKRLFDLDWRGTDYQINHHKLTINTKEIELNIDPAKAIEGDVFNYMLNNSCALESQTGVTPTISGCSSYDVDLNDLMLTQLSEINTVDEFDRVSINELIDVKNRQSIQSYPTLKLMYDRYLSNTNCNTVSNGYSYSDMESISELVGNYWVDLIEQFIPATTIWGSTLVYRNTIFDTQKHQYKSNTLWLCEDPSKWFPFSALSSDCNTQVIKVQLTSDQTPQSGSTPFDSSNFFSCEVNTYCDCVWTMTNYCNSEFIGRIIGGADLVQYCEETYFVEQIPLVIRIIPAPNCSGPKQTWDSINRVFSQTLKISDTNNVPITENYDYTVIPYGNNPNGITFSVVNVNESTILINWGIPIDAEEPTENPNCSGYYINNTGIVSSSWDVQPLIIVTDPVSNCEITRMFIYSPK